MNSIYKCTPGAPTWRQSLSTKAGYALLAVTVALAMLAIPAPTMLNQRESIHGHEEIAGGARGGVVNQGESNQEASKNNAFLPAIASDTEQVPNLKATPILF
jgi:hypothetical protein